MTDATSDALFPGALSSLKGGSLETSPPLVERVRKLFPAKGYCLVEQWVLFRADLTVMELKTVHGRGYLPLFIFAHKVVEDSRGRFQPGDWVRSSMCVSFDDGVMFETKNSVYVLMGPGHEQTANLKTIFSFF